MITYDIMVKKGAGHVLMRIDEFIDMKFQQQLQLLLEQKIVFVRGGKIVPVAIALRDIRLAQWSG